MATPYENNPPLSPQQSDRENTIDQPVPHPDRFPGDDSRHAFVLAQADSRLSYSQEEAPNSLEETRDQWFEQRNIREL